MKYRLYKLQFLSPVHFGSDILGTSLEEADYICHSDTFFSALCLECIRLNGLDFFEKNFISLFTENKLLISSLLPYKDESLYVPKPIIVKNCVEDNITKNTSESNQYDRKAIRKISYLKISDIESYLKSLNNSKDNSFLNIISNNKSYNDFAKYYLIQKVSLRRNNDLYAVGGYHFNKNSGLYFILAYNDISDLKLFENILESLKYSFIGGKRTSGYGHFQYNIIGEDNSCIFKESVEKIKLYLPNENNQNGEDKYNMILSLYSPTIQELDHIDFKQSFYSFIKRNGFIYSTSYSDKLLKRKSLNMFREGSCFKSNTCIIGDIKDLSADYNKKHSVYRYGKVLYLIINL